MEIGYCSCQVIQRGGAKGLQTMRKQTQLEKVIMDCYEIQQQKQVVILGLPVKLIEEGNTSLYFRNTGSMLAAYLGSTTIS
jgi:hypothetical protein